MSAPTPPSLAGRTCVVTGGTSGIGFETAQALAAMGGAVTIVCRDRARGEAARAAITAATGTRDVGLAFADLAVQADVRRVAEELLARCPAIHVLVNNAGVVNLQRTRTADGIEQTFAVNHLAYYLLTRLLLPRLQASAPARIVNVASEAHRFGGLDFDDLQNAKSYRSMRVYGQSKLCNVLFTAELARRLEGTGVTVTSCHPGAVATRLGQNNGRIATVLTKLLAPFFRSPAQGADTSIWLASAPEVAGVSGRYFAKRRQKRPSDAAQDPDAQRRLWEVSATLTGLPA